MNRRSFLFGLGSALAAPVIVKAEILMPVKRLLTPDELWKYPIDDTYFRVLNELSNKGVPIPFKTQWEVWGAQLITDISDILNREGFMYQLLKGDT